MKKILFTFLLLTATMVVFGQTNARERAEDTSNPEIDNLSGLKPDEDQLTPTSGVASMTEDGTENGGTGVGDELGVHVDHELDLKSEKINPVEDAQVYPNPAQDMIYIATDTDEGLIRILNLLGQEMSSHNITATVMSLDISELKEGIYFVSIESGDYKIVKKIKIL
jgi:hypothetical protein